MKKVLTLAVILYLSLSAVFGQNVLNNLNYSWSIVVPGKVVCPPAVTSYGFSVITDAKLLSTYSNSGRLLWEKSVNRIREANIYVLPEDFLLLSSDNNKKLTLLNPSGCELWTKSLDFQLQGEPSYGYDGRMFLKGNSQIECIGITGLTKWKLSLETLSKVPVQQLPDGSILALFSKTEGGKTKGLRISPFGEKLEEIIFAGEIIKAWSNEDGVFLTFADGTAGYFSIVDQAAKNKWVLQTGNQKATDSYQIQNADFLVCQAKEDVFYLLPHNSSVALFRINPASGVVKSSFSVNNINGYDLKKIVYNSSGIFISDSTRGYFFKDDGTEVWSGKFLAKQGKTDWNYLMYTNDNYLIFCETNWSLNAYRVSQSVNKKSGKEKAKTYSDYYTIDTSEYEYIFKSSISGEVNSEERIRQIEKGNYGTKEIFYASELLSACEVLKNNLNSNPTNNHNLSVFDIDTIGTQRIINQLTKYSCSTFINYEALFIQKINNKSLLQSLLNGVKDFGYDPNGTVLKSLEILAKKTTSKEEGIIALICDATYSVCAFMGRPAFNSKGKEILQNFMFPNYNANTRAYARDTLKKISALDL